MLFFFFFFCWTTETTVKDRATQAAVAAFRRTDCRTKRSRCVNRAGRRDVHLHAV